MTQLDTASNAFVLADPAERDGAVRPHEDHALSSQQLRMWLLERLYGAGRAYNVPQSLRLHGELDPPTLQAAVERVIARHDVLRTTFLEVDGRPVQRVKRFVPGADTFALRDHDLTGMVEQDAELRRLIAEEADAPFDLERGPLIRGRLVRLGANDWVLLVTMHHIVSDAQSFRVLAREVGVAYAALLRGEAPLPPLATQYAEYAAWQQATIAQGPVAEQEDYWRNVLAGAPELLELPTDFRRTATQTFDGDHLEVELDEHLTEALRKLSLRRRATLFSTLLAAWGLVLSRMSGQSDVVVGITTANRRRREDGELIGFFANTLPVRLDFSGGPTLRELMQRAMTRASEAQLNDDVPFERIVTLSRHARSTGHAPLVQAMFTWLGEPDFTLELPGVASAPAVRSAQRTSRLDLTLRLEQRGNRITGGIEYATSLFERATVAHFAESLRRVLEEMVAADDQRADLVDLVSAAERAQLVDTWNATEDAAPRDVLVHEWFERQAGQTPHAVAVAFHDEQLSYAELNRRADRLAHRLRTLGVGPDVRVALCLGRSVELVTGALAVLKAGGAYVPLDPEYPTERLRYLLADSAPAVVLTVRALAELVEGGAPLLLLDGLLDDEDRAPAGRPEPNPAGLGRTAEHLAYVIYTSGSTGKPKGVMVAHRTLVNHLSWRQRLAPLEAGDALLQKIAVGFDVSVGEMFWPLLAGARLVVAPPGAQGDPDYLAETIARERITTAVILPPQLRPVFEHPAIGVRSTLRHVVTGGEDLPDAAARAVLERLPRVSLYHEYGLTETTVTSTGYFYPRDGETSGAEAARSIGRPVANARAYVLDAAGALVPVGVVGELWIGGAGVARGYHGRAALTAERFGPDPFGGEPGARLYRTGDLVRWRRDGTLEFLGRNDFQVKIRGFRIELGEIEAQLQAHAAVREAVVHARADAAGQLRLVAYWTGEAECGPDELRSALAARLPEHMVPSAYVRLAELPRTPNGKVDRAALPQPGDDAFPHRAYEAPLGETEATLASIWAEVLGLERVGRRDHFFELGGSSLLVVRAAGQMSRRGLHADAQAFFTTPVLSELATRVEGGRRDAAVPPNGIPAGGCDAIRPDMLPLVSLSAAEIDAVLRTVAGGAANVQDVYPLAPLQEGILFHHLLTTRGDPYVLSALLRFGDRERLDAYVAALQAVVARHDILRTAVVWEGLREAVQVVWRHATLVVEDVALDAADGDVGEQLWARYDARLHRMDVRRAPLIRMWAAWDAPSRQWVLLQQQHHFIGDHVTQDELEAEVIAHLEGRAAELPPPMPFRTYVAQTRSAPRKAAQEAYFRALLADVTEPTAPFGLLDVWGDGRGIEVARRELPRGLGARLRAEARRLGVSVAALCHVAWAQVVARATARQDVVFGTVLFGRLRGGEGADRVMGPFINMLPVRVRVDAGGVQAAVRGMHAQLAELLAHEQASLAVAQRASGVPAPAPLFTSFLNYRHNPAAKAMQDGATLRGVRRQEWTSYPLVMSVDDLGDGLRLVADVHASVGAARTCAMMERALETLIDALEHAPGRALGALDVLPAEERRQVVEEWNRTAAPSPFACIHQMFEEQVDRTPDAEAVVYEGESLTYRELDRSANRLAHALRARGVGPEVRVAICVERSPEMVVGLLAILKSGGAYVPLDPTYPPGRVGYQLQDSAAVLLLTQERLLGTLPPHPAETLCLDRDAAAIAREPDTRPESGVTPHNLAYIYYTSGSTGRPKGVVMPHLGVCNYVEWARDAYRAAGGRGAPVFSSIAVDLTLTNLLPLFVGQRVVLVPEAPGIEGLAAVLRREPGFSFIKITPTHLMLLNQVLTPEEAAAAAGVLVIGADNLPAETTVFWQEAAPDTVLLNEYGPTETVVGCSIYPIPRGVRGAGSVSIGRPIANLTMYVLDPHLEPVPVGVPGELFIGGIGVARGYHGRPELTAERFVPDPFASDPGARFYRTGDRARFLPDGNIEFLGRVDHQVKIRGFRIELGEIEAVLREQPEVDDAVVVVREDTPGDRRLVAYVVTGSAQLTPGELRHALRDRLPDYMVPRTYVLLEELPLGSSGKLDRKSLPAPEQGRDAEGEYVAPVGGTEQALAAIWAEVLGVEQVGRHDHFFELGGHSLLVVRAAEQMRQRGLHAETQAFFTAPVLAELAAQVDAARPEAPVPPNGIPAAGCDTIRPDMLPLVTLSESEIEEVVRTVEGGAANVQDIYPLAALQEGILFHHLLAQDGDPYLLAGVRTFPDRQQLDTYAAALQAVVARHDILRTAVVWEGLREPVQVVWRHAPVVVEDVALEAGAGDVGEQLWARYNPRHYRADVRRAPLLRLWTAWDAAQGAWVALLHFHHLIGDHVTVDVLEEELTAHLEGRADELPPPLPFRTYVARARQSAHRDEHEAYFRNLLGDIDEPTAPFGLLDVLGDGRGIEDARGELPGELAARVRAEARRLGVSAASLCHVAWGQVLARTTGREHVVFGTVLFGRFRSGEGSDRVMGPFLDTLPVRVHVGTQGAREAVRAMHAQLAQLLSHEHASLALAQRCSAVAAPAPLFTTLLNYRHNHVASPGQKPGALRAFRAEERTNYPITMSVDDLGSGLRLTAKAPGSLGAARVYALMEQALTALVGALEHAPESALGTLEVLPDAERAQVVDEWNATAVPDRGDALVHDLFEQQVDRTPDAVAVVFEGESVSYQALNGRANRMARHLRGLGVGPDVRVALCVERSIEMVVAVLAVLKAGGAYVPLDPDYPEERLHMMLADSQPAVVLTQRALRGRFAAERPVIVVDDGDAPWRHEPATNLDRGALTPEHLTHVGYTSGSTGRPKGVENARRATANRMAWMRARWGMGPGDVVLQNSSISFDASLIEILLPLTTGGRLVLPRLGAAVQALDALVATVCRERVTTAYFVCSLLQLFVEADAAPACTALTRVLCGGEPLSGGLVRRFYERLPGARLHNLYGPSELAVTATTPVAIPEPGTEPVVAIGRPTPNTRVYVLDGWGSPVPVGVVGELWVGGVQMARGYHGQRSRTAERFVPDPFGEPGGRLYRTGDLARWHADGALEFLGRSDFQVKVRGYRIEPGEVEARLLEHAAVRRCVVVVREGSHGDQRLVAYWVAEDGSADVRVEALRTHLVERLPEYMVPAAFVRVEAMPQTPSGKLDRKALPAPDDDAFARGAYEAPAGETETTLAEIWAEILGVARVGRGDHFFELGGHSLLAIRLIERMRQRGLRVEVRAVFTSPTLSGLASHCHALHDDLEVPAIGIPDACAAITPGMVTLVDLTQDEIDWIVGEVEGGAANVRDIYPLAPLQEGILFHHMMATEGDPYVTPVVLGFERRDRLDAFLAAWQSVIDRHDILRTAVLWKRVRTPVQVVWRRARLSVTEVELSASGGDAVAQLWEHCDPRRDPMDVRRAPLVDAHVAYDAPNDRWLLLQRRHHLVSDHTTQDMVRSEIAAFLLGHEAELPPPVPFRSHVARAKLGARVNDDEAYFRHLLGDVTEPTAPFDLLEVMGDGSGADEASLRLETELADRLLERARVLGLGVATLCHVAWAQVLARVTGRDDVVFGTLLFGRMRGADGLAGAMGPFINTLPVRVALGDVGVERCVRDVHAQLGALLRHEHASLGLAQRASGVPAPAPLFTSLLNYRYIHQDGGGASWTREGIDGIQSIRGRERTNYPIGLAVNALPDGHSLTAQAPLSIGAHRVCALMRRALEALADALETAPERAIRTLDVLPDAERRQVVREWNATDAEYSRDSALVHELFEWQVGLTPAAVAVAFEAEQLSYAELDRRANGLAHHLRALGVGPDVRVAVCLERSPELVVAVLGVLKAGGVYVPIDPEYPAERLRYLLTDSAPAVVLTQQRLAGRLPGGVPVVDVDAPVWAGAGAATPPARGALTPGNLAYVLYTSGSTGEPKGVMVAHGALVNQLSWRQEVARHGPGDAVLQRISIGFDVSLAEMFWPLVSGARLVVARPGGHREPAYLADVLCRERVSTAVLLPAEMRDVLEAPAIGAGCSVRLLISGGEALGDDLARDARARLPDARLLLEYGLTETTVTSTARMCGAPGEVPGGSIGGPVANTRVYVLDERGEPAPVGARGELYVGGAQVARGYQGRAGLTAERFVPDPYGPPGSRLYRTGDVARWRGDATLEYLGRADFQVKVRGFRVELGEIEARLRTHAGVREAAVAVWGEGAGARLVAYYASAEAIEVEALRAHLSDALPEHMVPAAYVRLEALPLTVNGKVDRQALPAPTADAHLQSRYEAPASDVEAALAAIWSELLRVDRVGRHDQFFALGGHSLLVVQLTSRLRQVLGVEVAVGVVFGHPVLADLARAVERARGSDLPPIDRMERRDRVPVSFAQQRLWFLERLGGLGNAYHIAGRMRLLGPLDAGALRRALDRLVARHEPLRTTFVLVGDAPEQRIAPPETSRFALAEHDLRECAGGEAARDAALERLIAAEADTPFDLERGPLVRAQLVRLADAEHVLLVTMHHIVSDGWSMGVFLRELNVLYAAFQRGESDPLPPLTIQYADYAAWQRRWVTGDLLQRQASYWQETLAGAPELLELPTDRPRPAQREPAAASVPVVLDAELTAALKELSRRQGTTMFVTLLAGWAAVLSRLSGQRDVVIGTATANRSHAELEPLIGFFVNTLALRVDLTRDPTVAELMRGVKTRTIEAQEHQDIPFEHVVERVRPVRSLAHTPVTQVVFAWQQEPVTELELAGVRLGASPARASATSSAPVRDTNFDLTLSLAETGGEIRGDVKFATALFERETIERHAGYLRRMLEHMVAGVDQRVAALPLLADAERQRVVERWNATDSAYEQDALAHELFERQVGLRPAAVAVVFGDEQVSYAELNERATRLAHYLRVVHGVGPESRVALCVGRSVELIVAILGVLKAGGAYVPLDPGYPTARLQFMLDDSAPVVILTAGDTPAEALGARSAVPVVDLGRDAPVWAWPPQPGPSVPLAAAHPAYVIYTSGSTGRPKGVVVTHGGVCNLVAAQQRSLRVGPRSRVLQFASSSFDACVFEWVMALCQGAALHVPNAGGPLTGDVVREVIERAELTHVTLPPSLLATLPVEATLASVETMVVAGEALPAALVARWARGRRMLNAYGPTETTVWATQHECRADAGGAPPIGAPIANTRVYVLDECGEPAPIGVRGELYVGGAQLARGYRGRPGLTAERFVPDPYGAPGSRLYRTGDVARWRGDGALEYLGRADFQVKVRGFRIEPGEIEARLEAHTGVREAVVAARAGATGDVQLVAYYVESPNAEGREGSAEVLRAHLRETLPEYMVPAAYVRLDALPLTPNGKVDRNALPAPDGDAFARHGYEPPVGAVEQALAEVWAEVLGVERVGRHDHFFELGGHSLLAVTLIERLRRRGMRLEVRALFATPTLAELAATVGGDASELPVPPNRIPADCERITPELLPLAELTQQEIDEIVAKVPGGAANVQDVYPLAPLQEGILFHHLMAQEGDPYILAVLRDFPHRAALDAYVAALQAVVARHDILRTAMAWEGLREPVQVVWRHAPVLVEEVTLDAGHGDADEQLWTRYNPRHFRLDVRRAPLLHLWTAWDAAQDAWVTLLHFHHLIGDHVTLDVLETELAAHLEGRADELPPALPFRTYVARARQSADRDEHEAYFRQLLGDVVEPTAPFGLLDAWGDGSEVEEARLALPPELSRGLRARARALGVTVASVCHVAWAQVVARATARRDVVFGTVLFGRTAAGDGGDRVPGPFINTLPMRIDVGAAGAEASVHAAHAQLGELLRHEHASLALAQRTSGVPAPAPLFTALLNYRFGRAAARPSAGVASSSASRARTRNNYPVTLNVSDLGDELRLTALVAASVGAARVCALMHTALASLVAALEEAPETPLTELEVLPAAERALLLDRWNATDARYPDGVCLHELVEQQVARTPDAVALVFADEQLSYAELDRRATRLAEELRAAGVGPDVRVGLCLERSLELVVAILGVLKAGGAYVPLDPSYPAEQLRHLVADSAPAVVLLQPGRAAPWAAAGTGPRVIVLGERPSGSEERAPAAAPAPRLATGLTAEHLAYVLYTSGSTGRPKGVRVSHRNVVNVLRWMRALWQVDGEEIYLQKTPYNFDASLRELLLPLVGGARLVVARPEGHREAGYLVGLIARERVTTLHFVPSLLELLLREAELGRCAGVRRVVCGGEALPPALARRFQETLPGARLWNVYGPTEAAVDVTALEVRAPGAGSAGKAIPLGAPMANTRAYVLDDALDLVPVGVAGELYLGGAQVAQGYHGQPALTADRFVADPFTREPGGRLYRTGDLARWRSDGTLEYLGRVDHQVKVRGFRIELGEIEAQLREHAGVREAVVLAREDEPGETRLVAYWVRAAAIGAEALRAALAERLPEHMVPAAFVELEHFPLMPNGKLDRKALPSPDLAGDGSQPYEAPDGETETALAELWMQVLGVERVSRGDNFAALGGHSLRAIMLVGRIKRHMGTGIPLQEVFKSPTLADMARCILMKRLAQFDPETLARLEREM